MASEADRPSAPAADSPLGSTASGADVAPDDADATGSAAAVDADVVEASTAPYRVRDLDRAGRLVAVLLVLLLAVPFVAAVLRQTTSQWTPLDDDALIGLRIAQVIDGQHPLVGQPSTAGIYSAADEVAPRHPGPIEFYAFAPIVKVLGDDVGMLVAPAIVNFAALVLTAWVLFRRAGPRVALLGIPVLALLAYAEGPLHLVDPLSSSMGAFALLALAACAWGIVDGDLPLLLPAAVVFAWAGQQHLAVLGLAGILLVWAGLGVLVAVGRRVRRRPGPAWSSVLGWLGAAMVVTLILWSPVVFDQLFRTHNITQFLHYSRDSTRPTVGLRSGLIQAQRVFALPPILTRTDFSGASMWRNPSVVRQVTAPVVALAALVLAAVDARAGRRGRALLIATVFVVAAAGAFTGANVPQSIEADRPNFYRWVFVGNTLLAVAVLWWSADLVRARFPRPAEVPAEGRARRARRSSAAFAVGATAVATALAVVGGLPRVDLNRPLFPSVHQVSGAAVASVRGEHRVLLVSTGALARVVVGPNVALALASAGHDLVVLPDEEGGYGPARVVAGDDYDVVVQVRSGVGGTGTAPGRRVSSFDLLDLAMTPEQRRAYAAVVSLLESGPLTLDRSVTADLPHNYDGFPPEVQAEIVDYTLTLMSEQPTMAARDPLVIEFLARGLVPSSTVDVSSLRSFDFYSVRRWGDDVLEVRTMTPEEFRSTGR